MNPAAAPLPSAPVRPWGFRSPAGRLRHVGQAAAGGTDLVPFEVVHPMAPRADRPWGGPGAR